MILNRRRCRWRYFTGFLVMLAFAPAGPVLALTITGETTQFTSARGVTERCVQITPLEGARYSKKDLGVQADYCAIDLALSAMCPKLWSTSPGTVIYALRDAANPAAIDAFEEKHCPSGHHAAEAAKKKLASYKISVNGRSTSATFAPSSWVYFHFSRYLDTNTYVPPSVFRSFDREEHHRRVTQSGLSLSGERRSLRMLHAGWEHLEDVETGELRGAVAAESLTGNGELVYGVLLDNKGDRYGPEINGTRESGWGEGQNYDFQQTPGYLALRNPLPLAEAAAEGLRAARKNPAMAKKVPAATPLAQIVFWMNDLLEITLLDYLLGQQDRVGNIDYSWRWYWIEDGELKSDKAHGKAVPETLAVHGPVRLRRSALNDNDAGIRRGYANFARRTEMLKGLRHYNPRLYERFYHLAQGLVSRGTEFQWLTKAAGLSQKQAETIATRAEEALAILREDCEKGLLALDLNPVAFVDPAPAGDRKTAPDCSPVQ